MGGQQPSLYARVDYVDGKAKDTERRIDAVKEDYRKDYENLCRNLDERMNAYEAKIAAQDAVISSLQTILSGVVANPVGRHPVPQIKENRIIWLHVRDAARICRSKYGVNSLHGDISKAFVWAGILERKSAPNGNGYSYSILKKGIELNLVRKDPGNKAGFQINPERLELLAGILREYCDWIENGRKEE